MSGVRFVGFYGRVDVGIGGVACEVVIKLRKINS